MKMQQARSPEALVNLSPTYTARFHKIVNRLPTSEDMFFESCELKLALKYWNRLESLMG
jgi:hypothetical protein